MARKLYGQISNLISGLSVLFTTAHGKNTQTLKMTLFHDDEKMKGFTMRFGTHKSSELSGAVFLSVLFSFILNNCYGREQKPGKNERHFHVAFSHYAYGVAMKTKKTQIQMYTDSLARLTQTQRRQFNGFYIAGAKQ